MLLQLGERSWPTTENRTSGAGNPSVFPFTNNSSERVSFK